MDKFKGVRKAALIRHTGSSWGPQEQKANKMPLKFLRMAEGRSLDYK